MHRITLRTPCGTKERADLVLGALAPELGESVPKSRAEGRVHGQTLIILITSPELAALRAAANSYLRWIELALRTVETVDRGTKEE